MTVYAIKIEGKWFKGFTRMHGYDTSFNLLDAQLYSESQLGWLNDFAALNGGVIHQLEISEPKPYTP